MAGAISDRSLIGSFMLLAKQACPDVFYGINVLTRFMDKPTKTQTHGAKQYCDIFMVPQNSHLCFESKKVQL